MASLNEAPPSRHGPIEQLSVELKTMIAEHLTSTRDQKALCLTSKVWALIALPVLWRTWHLDLRVGTRDLRALQNPLSNVAKHVENIIITKKWENNDLHIISMDNILGEILKHVPKNEDSDRKRKQSRIHGFQAMKGVSIEIFKDILASHELRVLKISSSYWSDLMLNIGAINFSKLETVNMSLDAELKPTVEELSHLCPILKHLNFVGLEALHSYPGPPGISTDWFTPTASAASLSTFSSLKLRSLSFQAMSLKPFRSLNPRVDVLELQKLALVDVEYQKRVLDTLCQAITGRETKLKIFILAKACHTTPAELSASLTALLGSFQGLEQLHIRTDCDRIDGSVIANHGATLTTLSFVGADYGHRNDGRTLNVSDLSLIVTSCKELEDVCLNIYNLHTEKDDKKKIKLHHAKTTADLAIFELGKLPNLKYLRFTDVPEYREACDRRRYFGHYKRHFNSQLESGRIDSVLDFRALHVFNNLEKSGRGTVKILAFAPTSRLPTVDARNDGATWPNYVFPKGVSGEFLVWKNYPLLDWKKTQSHVTIFEDIGEY